MIGRIHSSHFGIEYSVNIAKRNVFWPNMTNEIKDKVKECEICTKYQPCQRKPEMVTHQIPTYPFQYISMDVFFVEYQGKQSKILVTVDHYSDFFELDLLQDLSSKTLIKICKKNFSRHGIPEIVCTDNGTNFVNKAFQDFSRKWFFKHTTSAPNHQQGNGKAEATVKIAKNLIKKVLVLPKDYFREIREPLFQLLKEERLFSRNTRTIETIPTIKRNLLPKPIADVTKHIENQRRLSKGYYDSNTKKYPDLKIVQVDGKIWSKGNIKEKLPDNSYIVKVDENCYRRSEVNVKPRQETEESTSDKETTQNDTHNKLTMPPESEEDVSSKPATTRQSETTPTRRDPEDLQCHPNQKKMCRANQQPQGRAKRPQRGGTLRKLSSTRIYRRRDQVVDRRRHLPLKYKDFVM
ncbi:Integrase zinc binding domain [Popillia japonica]|uniref:RNA-directed DNA polymerase n=1 Tax=Popillia japonica TaxID=7064 RepID=A0AAW1IER7_POPJA